MRWIFLSLVIVNVGYFGWQEFAVPGPRYEDPPSWAWAGSREISLLREREQKSAQEFVDVVSNPIIQTGQEERDGERCASIGPFPDLFAGWQLVDHLAALDIGAEVKAVDEPTGKHDYRVLMPAMASLPEAFRKLRELKSRNIDSYVLTEGKNALGISLGVYSSEEGAARTMEQLEQDGYELTLVEIPRFHREYWIFPLAGLEFQLEEQLWDDLVTKQSLAQKRKLECR